MAAWTSRPPRCWCRNWCTAKVCVRISYDCAQIFGGNRYMEEYAIARVQRDALAFSVGAGTSEIMREIIARTQGLEPGAPQGTWPPATESDDTGLSFLSCIQDE